MNDETFREVYQQNYRLIYQEVLLRTQNMELAADICQQTFLKYIEHRKTVKVGAERGWLLTVAKHLLIDEMRRTKVQLLDDEQIYEGHNEYSDSDMEKEMMRRDFLKQILIELEAKNRDWYEAVYEVCMLNIPEAEVARKKNISIDLLRTRLYRGRQFLKDRFGSEYKELR